MPAAIYTRISRDPNEEGAGVARQEKDCRAMLARAGHDSPLVYCDNNRSAWKRDRKRPGWDELLRDIKSGRVTALAIWHPDRLIRQPYDLEELIRIADRGLPFITAGGGRDLGDADDRFVLRIETAAACKSSDDASRRLRRFFEDHAMTGRAHGGPRPFGLQANRVDHETAEVEAVREVARRLLAGDSLRSVTAYLNSTELRPTRSTPENPTSWSGPSVKQMLLRPSIAGIQVHKGEAVGMTADAAAHGPILDNDTWTAVCALLQDPARKTSTGTAPKYLLSGLAKCSECGAGLRRTKTEGRPRYWCGACLKIAISWEHLDAFVVGAVTERLLQVPKPTPTKPGDDRGTKIIALQARLDELTERAADPDAESIDRLLKMISIAEKKLLELRAQQAETLHGRVLQSVDGVIAERWTELPLERRRSVVSALVERLVVHPAVRAGAFDPARIEIAFRDL